MFQEMVLQLWKSYPKFRNESAISTWMYRIGLNTAISHLRKRPKNVFKISLSEDVFQIPDPAYFATENTGIAALHQAIAQLNTIEKAIMMLYLEEKSYREIALILGITKSNVGVKISRIKEKLEIILKSYNHEL